MAVLDQANEKERPPREDEVVNRMHIGFSQHLIHEKSSAPCGLRLDDYRRVLHGCPQWGEAEEGNVQDAG